MNARRSPADSGGADATDGDLPGYGAALAELERILAELESSDVDVDVLATKVARAAALIRLCKSRIADARVHVEAVVAELDGAGEG